MIDHQATRRDSFAEARRRVRAGEAAAAVAEDFVAGLTIDEKLACLDGDEDFWPGLRRMAGAGRLAGEGYSRRPYPAAVLPDVGFPGIAFSDGPRGVVVGQNTCFPVTMARGATWDLDLEERVGDALGRELRARGATLFGGVCVNLLRHPAWGRAQETYGEDPHHVGEMGAALARGVQNHAMACAKHFALNSMENARFKVDVNADERTLHEVYLPHFKRIVDEGVACVMSAYNSVNGEWCGQNRTLLKDILRDEWGFEGFVISDWIFGLRDAVRSIKAGLDVEMPFRQQRIQHAPRALAEGLLTEDDVEEPARHLAATLLRFDSILSAPAPGTSVVACDAHRELAYEAAVKSVVLLKNDLGGKPLLPLDPTTLRRVALLGRLAAVPNLGDRGSSNVVPPSVITPLEGLRSAFQGVDVIHDDGSDTSRAAEVAREADVAIVVVGCTYEDEGEYIAAQPDLLMATAPPRPERLPAEPAAARRDEQRPREAPARAFATGGDRRSLELSEADRTQVHAAAAANPRTVIVLMGGSAILVEGWHGSVAAIIMLWYPGMEGGRALADIVFGAANPSGRLPFALPTDASHLPPFDSEAETAVYDLFHGQWLLDRDGRQARYPFGYGLSYATTAMRNVSIGVEAGAVVVEATVVNESGRDTSEVIQVYAGARGSALERPAWRLVGFARADVPAHDAAVAQLTVPLERLAVRVHGAWQIEDVRYEIAVGLHAHDPAATVATVRVA
jgi:beta-glucosidase